ncbi:cytochrome b [Rugamonas sp. CCM 8940]|uniref:cytochrome b n=1 Tax=Rugamonas sp. CCM 8940 TaxID=2765359 RepID=UPI0018F763FA|nr:cytochrome b [Rugamonas sp. CCM 8940]MBJ7311605.1 cytochrome b [Rugamonas sp. CCM 8940]
MQRYTKTAMLIHWLTALLIIAAFFLGLTMTEIHGITPTKLKYYSWHKWLGVTVLLLAVARVLWRRANRPPPHPLGMPAWQAMAADATHLLLYLLIFAVPLSGYLYSSAAGVPVVYLGLIPLPTLIEANAELKPILKTVHYVLTMTMAAAVVGHVLAALKHQFIDRDGVLRRMLP